MKLFLLKILLFASLIFFFQTVILLIHPNTVKTSGVHRQIVEAINSKSDIVFFGDSTIKYIHPEDKDTRPTTEILSSMLASKKLIPLNHDAFDASIYEVVTNHIAKTNKTKYLIVPVNLRSFGYKWETSVAWQFIELKTYLKTYNTPLYGFIPFLENLGFFTLFVFPKPDSIYDENILTEIDFQKSNFSNDSKLKELLLLDYMYRLPENSRKLKSLSKIADLTNQSEIIPIFYITPVDYQYSELKYPDFKNYTDKNIKTIKDSLNNKKHCLLDLSYDLPTSYFAWQPSGLVNEHLDENGRKYIAFKIYQLITGLENNNTHPNCNLKTATMKIED